MNLENFSITLGTALVTGQTRGVATISCLVYNDDGTLLADYTGANALLFPDVLWTLDPGTQADLVQQIAMQVLQTKVGA